MFGNKIAIAIAIFCMCKISVAVQCCYNVSGTYGALISPGYPTALYPHGLDCYYNVKLSEGTAVALYILNFQLEVWYDYIQIFDGPSINSPLIANYSGTHYNISLTASSNEVFVYFHASDQMSLPGFYITLDETDPPPKDI